MGATAPCATWCTHADVQTVLGGMPDSEPFLFPQMTKTNLLKQRDLR